MAQWPPIFWACFPSSPVNTDSVTTLRFSTSRTVTPKMLEYFVAIVGLYLGYSLICLELNYKRASAMGIPLIRVPIDPLNIPFQTIEPHFFKLIDLLPPAVLPTFVPYLRRGWFFLDKAASHLRHGPIFARVTPRGIHVEVCDSEAIHDIFTRRLNFIRPTENYSAAHNTCAIQFQESDIMQSSSKYMDPVSRQRTWRTGHATEGSSLLPSTKAS